MPHNRGDAGQGDLTRARLAAIVTSSPDAIVGTTLAGVITDWNPAAERLFGYTATEAVGQPAALLTPPDLAPLLDTLLERVRAGERVEKLELSGQVRDGQRLDISLSVFPVRDEAGEIVASSAIARDITDRKLAEAELAAAHERSQELLERITDGFYALDRAWRFTYVNDAAERMLGRSREDLLGVSIWEAFPPTVETVIYDIYHRAMAEGVAASAEVFYEPLDTWFEGRAYPSPNGLSVVFQDVTERKRLARDLRVSEAKYRDLVQHLPALVYVQANDQLQTPLYFSPYLEPLTGYRPKELLARETHWLAKVHPDDRARVADEDGLALIEGRPLRIEYRYRRKDGSYIWVHDESVPIRDEAGAIVGFHGVLFDISERVRAEEERARLAAIVEAAEDAIISCTLDWTIASWNRGAEKLYGYPAEEAIGQPVTMLRPPERFDDFSHMADRVHAGESIEGVETELLTRDGRRVEVSLSLSPIRNTTGDVVALASIARDMTALRQAERALRIRDRAIAAATNGIVITDARRPDNPIIDVNPAFEAMSGYGREEVIGRNCRFLQGPFTDWAVKLRIRDAIARGHDVTATILNYRKDGSSFWNELHIAGVRDEAGALTHFVGIQNDVTERVEALATLLESEARLRGVWESTQDAMVLTDPEGGILAANPAYGELYGIAPAALVGQSFAVVMPEGEREAAVTTYRASFAGPDSRRTYDLRVRRADGSEREVEVRSDFIEIEGERQAMISALRDVTDRKRLEQSLRRALEAAQAATRAKSLFLSMMSHELRTPLQAVLGYADLLLLGPPASLTTEQREDLTSIRQGATRMMGLIEQMLDLSRMEAGRLELAAEPVDVSEIVEQVRQDIAPQAAVKGLRLEIDIPAALAPALGDPDRVRQILLNLAGNAVKFTERGAVSIAADAVDGIVQVAVRDTGIGITAEALPHIFEEFRQVDGNLTRRYGGAGLGLAIARRLAEQMGGTITVESMPEVGSTFTLSLPAARYAGARRRGVRRRSATAANG
ncbi:MAG: PAS domain S-box protein [Thermomicrobiales bacterium]|nr:PAS domain S-box protein [Thermomicrobiales bacterium]